MNPERITLSNPLRSREDVLHFTNELLGAVATQFHEGNSRVDIANTEAHYGHSIAGMEAFSRLLWGVIPMLAADQKPEQFSFYIEAIKNGTNPQHSQYWGDVDLSGDQRIVEMAAYGLLLALAPKIIHEYFNAEEKENLWHWLKQSEAATVPDNNWHFFPILVQVGFHCCGMPVNQECIEEHFSCIEKYWLGDGWYSDGLDRARDYYISMGFHFYGLIYSKLMEDVNPTRSAELRHRAEIFAKDFIYFFDSNGAAIPFGRSMTYRFAQAAFWGAYEFAGLNVFEKGITKGIILRHLRWWLKQPLFDRDGVLSIGYSYPNLIMAEDYNAPGSPYWALKVMLVLALSENDEFWLSDELPMPKLEAEHSIPHANQIIVHQCDNHTWLVTSGQIEHNNFVNTESKYCKFAYSTRFGFTIERGRYGLAHASIDSMLLLSERDNYWRGRRECQNVVTVNGIIYSRWSPWDNVKIDTWLVPIGEWHVRIHHLNTARPLDCAEGGYSVPNRPLPEKDIKRGSSTLKTNNAISTIVCLSALHRTGEEVLTPPNSNLLFAERAAIPVLRGQLSIGKHVLATAVWAGNVSNFDIEKCPKLIINKDTVTIFNNEKTKYLKLNEI